MDKKSNRTRNILSLVFLGMLIIVGSTHLIQKITNSDYDGLEKRPEPDEIITEKLSDGDEYTGHFNRDSEFHGQGKYSWGDGGYFEGEFENGLFVKGTHKTEAGNTYVGEFNENEDYHGQGKYTWHDGGSFEGEFKEDLFYNGTRTYETGSIYVGYFNEDEVRHGQGKMVYSDGTIFEGEWKDGEMWNGIYIDEEGDRIEVIEGS